MLQPGRPDNADLLCVRKNRLECDAETTSFPSTESTREGCSAENHGAKGSVWRRCKTDDVFFQAEDGIRDRQIRVRTLHRLGASDFWTLTMRITRGWQRRDRIAAMGLLWQSRCRSQMFDQSCRNPARAYRACREFRLDLRSVVVRVQW